jgi:hypothetical protein
MITSSTYYRIIMSAILSLLKRQYASDKVTHFTYAAGEYTEYTFMQVHQRIVDTLDGVHSLFQTK